MPRITILMPVYNGEKFLKKTIESVLQQTYTDFAFLIINDGSTDNSEAIIRSYTDTRIHYEKNEVNMGLVATLNKGIDMINTEFMARMDADDLWDATKLEKQLAIFDTHPDIGLCGTSIHKFGNIEGDFYFPTDNAGLQVGFIFYCCMSHPSVIFRMSFLHRSGLHYHADYYPAEDYKMWIDCLPQTRIYNIPEKLVFYRQHNLQITQHSNIAQTVMTDKVRWEMISPLSSNFSDAEKEFHLTRYVRSSINSTSDYKQFVKWSHTLIKLNRQKHFIFNKRQLKKALYKHNQASYLIYIKQKYFQKRNPSDILKYICSFNWIHLRLKLNLKLLLNKC